MLITSASSTPTGTGCALAAAKAARAAEGAAQGTRRRRSAGMAAVPAAVPPPPPAEDSCAPAVWRCQASNAAARASAGPWPAAWDASSACRSSGIVSATLGAPVKGRGDWVTALPMHTGDQTIQVRSRGVRAKRACSARQHGCHRTTCTRDQNWGPVRTPRPTCGLPCCAALLCWRAACWPFARCSCLQRAPLLAGRLLLPPGSLHPCGSEAREQACAPPVQFPARRWRRWRPRTAAL